MSKSIFDTLKEMNEGDAANGTRNVVVSPYFLRSQKTKAGGEVTMGIPHETVSDMMEDKVMFVLLAINKEEYNKLKTK